MTARRVVDATTRAGRSRSSAARRASRSRFTCNFLFMCSGYYDYDAGLHAGVPGRRALSRAASCTRSSGRDDIDYAGKRVVVIGSGATAVTLVPALAKTAAHVTMLQRSPTYIVSRPAEDAVANWLRRRLPAKLAYGVTRWKNVLLGMLFYRSAERAPERVTKRSLATACDAARARLRRRDALHAALQPVGPAPVPGARRRSVRGASRTGRASVVTDQIETLHRDGHRARARAPSSRRTSSSPRPASS